MKLKTASLIHQAYRKIYRDSYIDFVIKAFQVVNIGEALVLNWHIVYIAQRLQAEIHRIGRGEPLKKNLIINIPPRSLKSFLITVALPAWAWLNYPSMKFIGSSHSASLSIEHNVMTRRIVESEWYGSISDIEITSDQNQKSIFENTEHGVRMATSVQGSPMGKGGNVIVIDDPQNPKQAVSEVNRKAAKEHFDFDLSTRRNNPNIDMYIVVMQRLHEEDLTGHLLTKNPEAWEHICIPAEEGENISPPEIKENYKEGLFFPERFTRQYLDNMKASLGSYGYSGQFMQRPAPMEGGLIKARWFQIISELPTPKAPEELVWNFTIDGAYTEKTQNDPSAILAYSIYQNNMYIREVASVWKEMPELIIFVQEFVNRNGYSRKSRIYIEPKASGIPAAQILKRETNLNILLDKAPTTDKISRVNAGVPYIESGRVYLLKGRWTEDFIHQCAVFPNAKHDDEVDCLTMALDKIAFGRAKFRIS